MASATRRFAAASKLVSLFRLLCVPCPDYLLESSVLYFHNIFQLDDVIIAELLEQLCDLLRDPKVSLFPILFLL